MVSVSIIKLDESCKIPPAALSIIGAFGQVMAGAWASFTVTVKVAVYVLPILSVAV
jgi:hypothetical protein